MCFRVARSSFFLSVSHRLLSFSLSILAGSQNPEEAEWNMHVSDRREEIVIRAQLDSVLSSDSNSLLLTMGRVWCAWTDFKPSFKYFDLPLDAMLQHKEKLKLLFAAPPSCKLWFGCDVHFDTVLNCFCLLTLCSLLLILGFLLENVLGLLLK